MTGDVTLVRPDDATVEVELFARVGAHPARVFAVLASRIDPQGEGHFVTDPVTRRAVVQGDYWYRGEYAVDPDGDGARVTYTIVNVAPGMRLLGRLTGRRVVRSAPRDFARLIAEVEGALG